MAYTYSEVAEMVRRGIARLNQDKPGWFDKIDLSTFDITSSYHCVLGQVYGSFNGGIEVMGLLSGETGRLGFIGTEGNSPLLQELWVSAITILQRDAKRYKTN